MQVREFSSVSTCIDSVSDTACRNLSLSLIVTLKPSRGGHAHDQSDSSTLLPPPPGPLPPMFPVGHSHN